MSSGASKSPGASENPGARSLPELVAGDRRRTLSLLVGTGLLLAALAGATALFMTVLLGTGADMMGALLAGCGLVTAALGIGVLRSAERVLAERLGQSYIQEIRIGLLDAALSADRAPAAGITIARTTNDLTSVRNWVALGIAPLAVGIPLILGATLGLGLLSPVLAAAALVPLVVLGLLMLVLSRAAFDRARAVRRKRGRLASLLADTVAAAPVIRAAGGQKREVRRIGRVGQDVVDASIHRSRIAGYIRGAAAAAAAITVALVGIAGLWQAIDTATIAGALTIVGLMSAPITELGRVVEYRQNFKAARCILGPALATGTRAGALASSAVAADDDSDGDSDETGTERPSTDGGRRFGAERPPRDGRVSVVVPPCCASCTPVNLQVKPRDVVVLSTADPARVDAVFGSLLGTRSGTGALAMVDGTKLATASPGTRRRLVGVAAAGSYLERGTVARAVRYRRPDADAIEGRRALERLGLSEVIDALPRGERTELRRGGEPLTVSERARLLVARAALGDPPLLVLNRIDAELDDDGLRVLRDLIDHYPGVVLMAPGRPGTVALPPRSVTWSIDCVHTSRSAQISREAVPLTPSP